MVYTDIDEVQKSGQKVFEFLNISYIQYVIHYSIYSIVANTNTIMPWVFIYIFRKNSFILKQ